MSHIVPKTEFENRIQKYRALARLDELNDIQAFMEMPDNTMLLYDLKYHEGTYHLFLYRICRGLISEEISIGNYSPETLLMMWGEGETFFPAIPLPLPINEYGGDFPPLTIVENWNKCIKLDW